jgi:hypothetical protein
MTLADTLATAGGAQPPGITASTASAFVIFAIIAMLWAIVIVLSLDAHMGPDPEEQTDEEGMR